MDEPIDPNKIQPPIAGVSVPVGGVEHAPVAVGGVEGDPVKIESVVAPEFSVDVAPSEKEPVISEEVKAVGVVAHPTEPKLHPDARAVGVVESIPTFSNFPTDQNIAEQTVKTADVGTSDPWRALLVIKEFAKGLFGIKKPQEVN